MEHQTSTTLFKTGRRVTRYQCKLVHRTFPFLDLPPELRNIIYEMILDFCGIEAFYDRLHQHLMNRAKDFQNKKPRPVPRKRTPTLLLLNKQIFAEASYILQKRGVTFHHGLLTTWNVREVISPGLLQRVSSIHITDDGHPIIKGRILPESWNGYMRFLNRLGTLLADGHNLKDLTIKFSDERLKEHMTECVSTGHDCGFRDQMRNAINSLRRVHNVKKVTLIGLIPEQARELQDRMQKPAVGFGDLPRELRDMVYEHAVDWPDITKSLIRTMANWPDQSARFPYPRRSTPTMLLLNKQYTAEAVQVLRKKPLNITFPGDHNIGDQDKVPKLIRFISRGALKNVQNINIRMESWEWIFNIDKSFALALATSPHLKKFRLHFKDTLKPHFSNTATYHYPDEQLHICLRELKRIRGLEQATFGGDLPVCYTDALASIMTSQRYTQDQIPELKALNAKGEMVIIDDSEEDKAYGLPPASALI